MSGEGPLIAVPGMWSAKIQGLRYSGTAVANAVLSAIARAGGTPIVLPPHTDFGGWDRIDGIVVPGGADINPARYGAEPDQHDWPTDYAGQDDADAQAIRVAEDLGIPALLICRGMQLWNVERGGSMRQHLPSEPLNHVGSVHEVSVVEDSQLSAALGGVAGIDVSSYHHQGVGNIGQGLRVVASSADGVVEALEDDDARILAVQWHPEDRARGAVDGEVSETDSCLFQWIVEAAQGRRETSR